MLKLNRNKSGVIIIIVLWVLVILTVISVGLGRQTDLDLSLTKHYLDRFQTKYYAFAGLVHAAQFLISDGKNETTKIFDSLYQCGIPPLPEPGAENLFSRVAAGEGYFSLKYFDVSVKGQQYGFADEERKINLNGINAQNVKILIGLVELMGAESSRASQIGYSVVDWIDADDQLSDAQSGAEDEFYMSLEKPYHVKNRVFDSLEELVLVRGMDRDLLVKLKPFVTVFPKSGGLRVNIDTAPREVLQAMSRFYSGAPTNSDTVDADNLTDKIMAYRNGADHQPATDDDRLIEMNEMSLNAKERSIFLVMNTVLRTKTSNYFYIRSVGGKVNSPVGTVLSAVIKRSDLSVLSWQRN